MNLTRKKAIFLLEQIQSALAHLPTTCSCCGTDMRERSGFAVRYRAMTSKVELLLSHLKAMDNNDDPRWSKRKDQG